MYPSSIAFWGASNNPLKMGTVQLANVLGTGFEGRVFPIHPTEASVLGLPAHRSIFDVGVPVDLAQLTLPTDVVPRVLDECGRAGIRRAIIISGGFGEAGGGGKDLQRDVKEIAQRHGIRFLGPNCVGIFNSLVSFNSTTIGRAPAGGGIGFASQSGAYTAMINPYLSEQGIKMCQTISLGNEADIDMVDALDYFREEPGVKAVGLYVEAVRRPLEFIESARRTVASKPVVAVYVGGGTAGSRASLSHTGALSGPDALYDGLFREAGVVRAADIDEMMDALRALASQPVPAGDRVAVITNSGGPGASGAYHLEKQGFTVPVFSDGLRSRLEEMTGRLAYVGNPIDLTFEMDVTLFEKLIETVYESGEVDACLLYGVFGWDFMNNLQKRFPALSEMKDAWVENYSMFLTRTAALPHRFGKPLLVMSFLPAHSSSIHPLVENGVPVYPSAVRAARVLRAMRDYGKARGSGLGS